MPIQPHPDPAAVDRDRAAVAVRGAAELLAIAWQHHTGRAPTGEQVDALEALCTAVLAALTTEVTR